MPKQQNWGFDLSSLDLMVRPQDDFFHHVSGGWIAKNPIPESEARWGTFVKLRLEVDQQLHSILKELSEKKRAVKGSKEQQLRDYFLSGMDMKTRNALALKPLLPLLSRVEKLSSTKELIAFVGNLHRIGVGVFWNSYVDQDSKKTTEYRLHLVQGGLGMPDRDYYLKSEPEFTRVREAYRGHIERVFGLIGYTKRDAQNAAQRILALETKLAKGCMTKEDYRNDDKTYNKKTFTALKKLAPSIDWSTYFQVTGIKNPESFIVGQPMFFEKLSALMDSVSRTDWNHYLTFHIVNSFSFVLSAPFVAEEFSFYGKALQGLPQMKPLWRQVLGIVNGTVDELLGQEYTERHFTKEAKKKALLLVADLIEAYRDRIKKLEWMTPATKKKALTKLGAMNPKIGYPDKWKSYTRLVIDPKDYVGNIMRASELDHQQHIQKLGKPIDRKEWFMSPQTVNAYFAPSLNDIVFPAAILQPPFFSLTADDAVNYGSMGTVIGHELTHGFDDQGSKRDQHGNLKEWWTASDKKKFQAKTKLLAQQYDTYRVADAVPVSGKLTLGENTADLGGLVIAYDAYQKQLERTGRKNIDGHTPEQRFFLGFAVFECEHCRPEYQKTRVLTDPHSPGIFRINGVVTNVDSFYEAYGLKPGDDLYKPSAKRIRIW